VRTPTDKKNMKEKTLFEFNCSKRKSRVLTDLFIQFLLAILFLITGLLTKTFWLAIIMLVWIVIIIYSASIIKAKNFFFGKAIVNIEGSCFFEYNDLVSIKKKQLNFILQFNWSVKLNEYDRSKAWDCYLITFIKNNQLNKSLVLIDPQKRNDFVRFIEYVKQENNKVEILV
jgi:hypothetical protein